MSKGKIILIIALVILLAYLIYKFVIKKDEDIDEQKIIDTKDYKPVVTAYKRNKG